MGHAHDTVPTWDVEMTGRTGHSCHAYVMADSRGDAEMLAADQFPELEITGNTQEVA